MSLFVAQQARGSSRQIVIYDACADPIIPNLNDVIRASIGREGDITNLVTMAGAELVVASDAPTAAGSSFTKAGADGKNRLRLDADDLLFEPGCYTLFIDYFDNADDEEWKTVARHIFYLERT